jgi:hypothetical protein
MKRSQVRAMPTLHAEEMPERKGALPDSFTRAQHSSIWQ